MMKQVGDKCNNTRKSHHDILKSYAHIARVLTDGYALVASAHSIRYKNDTNFNRTTGRIKLFLFCYES